MRYPQALEERCNGWLDIKESQKGFEWYAKPCYEGSGDRAEDWITLNEPWNTAINVSIKSISSPYLPLVPGLRWPLGFVRCTEPPDQSSTHDACAPGDSKTQLLTSPLSYHTLKDLRPFHGSTYRIQNGGSNFEILYEYEFVLSLWLAPTNLQRF
jgi:hypothetical protein